MERPAEGELERRLRESMERLSEISERAERERAARFVVDSWAPGGATLEGECGPAPDDPSAPRAERLR